MNAIDLFVLGIYLVFTLCAGVYFGRGQKSLEDYYVGGRGMNKWHLGFSVIATDVGGGFSIGLGGLGFTMGLSGSWLLFSGLLGAWISAVLLIPKVRHLGETHALVTFPQIFGKLFDRKSALLAGLISAIGYLGFTSSQILAGAKLASASLPGVGFDLALWTMGLVAVVYTAVGGLKAVVFTDSIQWAVLFTGLIGLAIPMSFFAVGGLDGMREALPADFFSLSQISWIQFFNWMITIVPIWFIGMTLYQRIYASRSIREAQQAWYLAGLLEWPVMAVLGVLLGVFARVAVIQGLFSELGFIDPSAMDAELAIPLLVRTVLPVGILGIVLAAYFSAVLSTADSCLMASSGNIVSDLLGERFFEKNFSRTTGSFLRVSQITTLILGLLAVILASFLTNVLELMLYSYAFMISGLFIPLVAGLFWKRRSGSIAFFTMIIGGGVTVSLAVLSGPLQISLPLSLDPNFFGLMAAGLFYGVGTVIWGRPVS